MQLGWFWRHTTWIALGLFALAVLLHPEMWLNVSHPLYHILEKVSPALFWLAILTALVGTARSLHGETHPWKHQCPGCDLRASPERCRECGRERTKA
jgi:hypothetical protein